MVIWTTKEGVQIDIKDMGDSHLINTIRFLKRKINDYPGWQIYDGNGEMAEMAVEHENQANEEQLGECQWMLEEMLGEKKRRGI